MGNGKPICSGPELDGRPETGQQSIESVPRACKPLPKCSLPCEATPPVRLNKSFRSDLLW